MKPKHKQSKLPDRNRKINMTRIAIENGMSVYDAEQSAKKLIAKNFLSY